MPLPSRAARFIERLEAFVHEPAMAEFCRAAAAAFRGERGEIDAEDAHFLEDYVVYAHRDAEGRGAIDIFLGLYGQALDPEERAVYERMRSSVFGGFQVESVRPGERLTLRLCGSQERYEVVDEEVSRDASPRACIFTRLVPYAGHHEITGPALMYPESFVYSLERTARKDPKGFRAYIRDVRSVYDLVRHSREKAPQPENLLEAELHAGWLFRELKLPFSVEDIKRRLQAAQTPMEIFARLDLAALDNEKDVQRFSSCVAGLWNHLPREDLDGLTPREKQQEDIETGRGQLPEHLRNDLARVIAEQVDPFRYKDPRELRAATQAAVEHWYATPQDELDGLTPADVEAGRIRVVAPDVTALPSRDRPIWTPARLHEGVAACMRAERDWGLVWMLHTMARRGVPLPPQALARVLTPGDDGERIQMFLDDFPREAPAAIIAQVLDALSGRFEEYEGSHGFCASLRFLGWARPREYRELFESGLQSDFDCVYDAAVLGLVAARAPEAAPRLLDVLHSTEDPKLAARVLAGLILAGADAAVAEGTDVLIDLFAHVGVEDGEEEEESPRDFCDMCVDLARVGMGTELWTRVDDALFGPPDAEEQKGRAARREDLFAVFMPASDPAAARRAAEVVTKERRRRIERLADEGNCVRLAALLGQCATEAIALAGRDDPLFKPLGAAMAACIKAASEPKALRSLDAFDQTSLAALFGMFLAKALRGRDAERELARAGADLAAAFRDLLRLDEPWVTPELLVHVAAAADEQELLALSASPDVHVRTNSLVLLAVKAPDRHLPRVIERIEEGAALWPLVDAMTRAIGDVALDSLVAYFVRTRFKALADRIGVMIELIATERARGYAAHFFDVLRLHASADIVLPAMIAIADGAVARRMLDAFRAGDVEVKEAREDETIEDLTFDMLRALIEIYNFRVDPGECFEDCMRRFRAKHPDEEEEEEAGDEDAEEAGTLEAADEAEERQVDDRFTGLDLPADPFGAKGGEFSFDAQAPKPGASNVGRNDPCPCGSGKKYKNCCGK